MTMMSPLPRWRRGKLACAWLAVGAVSCVGTIDNGSPSSSDAMGPPGESTTTNDPKPADAIIYTQTSIRRLSKNEVRNTIVDLVGVDPNDFSEFKTGWPDE